MPVDLGSLTARIGLDSTPLIAGAAAARGELAGLADSGGGALGRLADIGKAAFLALGASAVVVGGASLKAASDFQASMELVRTQAGASQAEVDSMTASILRMATGLGTSPEALAQALFHIESAGFRGAQALDLLRIAAEGAKVGQANLEDVTNALIAVEVSHIKGVGGVADAMGVLNAIVGVGNVRMGDLAAAMGTGILSAAANFGLSLQDVGGALAVLTDNAVPADEAATRLRMTFSLMAAPTGVAQQALASIGLTSTQLADDMRHGGLIEAIGDLKQHLEDSGLTATEQAAVLTRAFGGGRTSAAIITLVQQFDRLKQKIGDVGAGAGTFQSSWEATKQTFKFQMDEMKAAVDVLGIRIGTFLIPIVTKMAQAVADAVKWLSQHTDIARALAAVVGGPLLVAMTAFVATEIAAAAPVLAVGAAIGVLAGAFVLAYEKIGPFHDAVNAVGTALSDFASAAGPKVQQFLGNLVTQLGYAVVAFKDTGPASNEFAQTIDNIFGNTGRLIPVIMHLGSVLQEIARVAGSAASAIGSFATGLLDQFTHFITYVRSIAPQVQEAVGHIVNVIRAQLDLVAGVFTAVFVAIRAAWQNWGDDIMRIVRNVFDVVRAQIETGIRIARDVINATLALINGDWGKFWNAISDIPKAALGFLRTVVGDGLKIIGNLFASAWDGIVAATKLALGQVGDVFRALPGLILDALKALPGLLVRTGNDLMTGLFSGIATGWAAVAGWFSRLPGDIISRFAGAASWLASVGNDVMTGLWNGIASGWNNITAWFGRLPGEISGYFSNAVSWLAGAGNSVMTGLWNGIAAGWGNIASWFGRLPGEVASWFSSAVNWLAGAGNTIMTGLWNGIATGWGAITGWFSRLPGDIGSFFAAAATWLYNAGIDLIKGFLNGMIAAMDRLPSIVQRFTGLDAVIRGLHDAVNLLDGAKVDITANADTTQAQQALDDLLRTLGGIVDYSHPPPPGSTTQPVTPPFAMGGLTHGPSLAGEAGTELILPMNHLARARQLLAQHGGAITGASGGSVGGQSSSTVYDVHDNVFQAPDPAAMERQLEARARIAAMAGR